MVSTGRIRTPIGRDGNAPVEMRLFGRPRVSACGSSVALTFPADTLYVLAYTAINGETERELIARELWPRLARTDGLARLRRQLALLDALRPVESAFVRRVENRLALNETVVTSTDIAAFDAACREGRSDEAVAIYESLLNGFDEPWIARARLAYERRYEAAVRDSLRRCEREGDLGRAAERALRLYRLHPLRDDAAQSVMRAHARAGDRSAALTIYADFAARLTRELGTTPLTETTRARDEIAGTPDARRQRGFLPGETSSFIGRETDIAAVTHLLREERLVTIVGSAGVGKTRTALRVADSVRPAFDGGAWFVDLTSTTDPGLIESALAGTLAAQGPASNDARSVEARLKDENALLIFDNCERWTAACATLVERLLRLTTGARIIATSREPLRLSGEAVYRLEPLPETDAIALFMRRSRNAGLNDAPSVDGSARVARICRKLDGLPLAIELAAARIPQLTLSELEERLTNRLAVLEHGFRDLGAQHRNLRVAFDWSYDALAAPARAIFVALSVFAGSWTADAASAICGPLDGGAIVDVLHDLAKKSLVTLHQHGSERRFRFLDSIREYASEKLAHTSSAAQIEELRRRHAEYMLVSACDAAAQWGKTASAAWYSALELDLDNFRAALRWSLVTDGEAVLGARLVAALGSFWQMGAYRTEGLNAIEGFLGRESELPTDISAALWLAHAGFFAGSLQRRESAKRAYDLYTQIGDEAGVALALHRLAMHYTFAGKFDAAADALARALPIFESRGDEYRIWRCRKTKADLLRLRGDDDAARALYESVLTFARETADAVQTESTLLGLAEVNFRLGAHAAAIAATLEARRSASDRHDAVNVAVNELNLAAYLIGAEQYDSASSACRRALDAALDARVSTLHVAIALQHFAALAVHARRPREAAVLLGFTDRAYRDSDAMREYTEARERERILAGLDAALPAGTVTLLLAEGESLCVEAAIALAIARGEQR